MSILCVDACQGSDAVGRSTRLEARKDRSAAAQRVAAMPSGPISTTPLYLAASLEW